jgi:hypothetical protein
MNSVQMRELISKFINFSEFLVLDSREEFLKPENFPESLFILVKRTPHCWHWVCCFRRSPLSQFWQLFHSLGRHQPTIATVAKVLNVKTDAITVNEKPVQCSQSDQCGGFCAYFAYQRIIRHRSIHGIVRQEFSNNNNNNNERIVKAFVTCLRRRRSVLTCKTI